MRYLHHSYRFVFVFLMYVATLAVMFLSAPAAHAQSFVVAPLSLTNTAGNAGFGGLFSGNYTVLQYIPAVDGVVPGLRIGDRITGVSYRLGQTGTSNAIAFSDYDVFLSQGLANDPGTSTFADCYDPGTRTQVRDGALSFAAGAFPSGATPNAFGRTLEFSAGFVYNGGALVLESRSVYASGDIVQTDMQLGGDANGFRVMYGTGSAATTADIINLHNTALIPQFTVVAVIPEPASVALIGMIGLGMVALRRRRK